MSQQKESVMTLILSPIRIQIRRAHSPKLPGSKSLTNRALALAASKVGQVRIVGGLHAEDTDQFARCIDKFGGISVTRTADGFQTNRTTAGRLENSTSDLQIKAAGTPARFLLTMVADSRGSGVVTGNDRLNERPMGPGLQAIADSGRAVKMLGLEGCIPARIDGGAPKTTRWSVSADVSSQFVSSALLSAARQDPSNGPIEVYALGNVVSRPYIDMTVKIMGEVGLSVREIGRQSWRVDPGEPVSDVIFVEPDASAMSYFLGAAAIMGTTVSIEGLGSSSSQGDVEFARVLERMGCQLTMNKTSLTLTGPSNGLTGIDVDMETIPDTVLTMAVVAAFAKGPTTITNIANLRVKECDRIAASVNELRRVGVAAEDGNDWLCVKPGGRFRPARIKTYDDHRVAMAFSLVGLLQPGIEIEDPACVAKSFPDFWIEYQALRKHFQPDAEELRNTSMRTPELA